MEKFINILKEIKSDNIQEREELQSLVNQNLFQIEKIDIYLKILFEKDDPEFKFFSPRSVETIYETQISSNQEKKKALEEENVAYYKKINRLSKHINQLNQIIDYYTNSKE